MRQGKKTEVYNYILQNQLKLKQNLKKWNEKQLRAYLRAETGFEPKPIWDAVTQFEASGGFLDKPFKVGNTAVESVEKLERGVGSREVIPTEKERQEVKAFLTKLHTTNQATSGKPHITVRTSLYNAELSESLQNIKRAESMQSEKRKKIIADIAETEHSDRYWRIVDGCFWVTILILFGIFLANVIMNT